MGVIVALYPNSAETRRLVRLTRAIGPLEWPYHVTLAYLGDETALAPRKAELVERLVGLAASRPEGQVGYTLGRLRLMDHVDEDGSQAVAATVHPDPALVAVQAALRGLLDGLGLPSEWPTWTPHLTLGYRQAGLPLPRLRVPRLAFACRWLYLCWGKGEHIVLPLGGVAAAAKADSYSPPASARSNARRGLELRRTWGRGGTAVGVARARTPSASTAARPTPSASVTARTPRATVTTRRPTAITVRSGT
jgi:2'-5' RNA ligase